MQTSIHTVNLSDEWELLGPFQTGTRGWYMPSISQYTETLPNSDLTLPTEAEWGADPLERFGGFRKLNYNSSTVFRSSLANSGLTYWSRLRAERESAAKLSLTVKFDDVDWDILRSAYGWAGLQFQAWVRGKLELSSPAEDANQVPIVLYIKNAGEIWIDGTQYFGGDVYGYERAPIIL